MQSNLAKLTTAEFQVIVNEEITRITGEAVSVFQNALQKDGLVLTEKLKSSFIKYVVSNSAAMIAHAQIEFQAYGRLKDLKRYSYKAHIPPVHEMEAFVWAKGIENFSWINKNATTRPSWFVSDARTINKIAWAIAVNKRRFPDVKRGYRGSWYNDNRMNYINDIRKRLRWRINAHVHGLMKSTFDPQQLGL